MAAPFIVKEILGSIVIPANTTITTASILATFTTANMSKLKTEGVRVSIDGYPMFPATYDAEDYINTGHTQRFDKDTILLIGKYVVIT